MQRAEWRFAGRLAVGLVAVIALSSVLSRGYMWVLGELVRHLAGVLDLKLQVGPSAISPWVLAAVAVIAVSGVDVRRRVASGAILVAGTFALDALSALAAPALGAPSALVEQAWTSLSAVFPLAVVIVMAKGRPATLWTGRTSSPRPGRKAARKPRPHKAAKRKH